MAGLLCGWYRGRWQLCGWTVHFLRDPFILIAGSLAPAAYIGGWREGWDILPKPAASAQAHGFCQDSFPSNSQRNNPKFHAFPLLFQEGFVSRTAPATAHRLPRCLLTTLLLSSFIADYPWRRNFYSLLCKNWKKHHFQKGHMDSVPLKVALSCWNATI